MLGNCQTCDCEVSMDIQDEVISAGNDKWYCSVKCYINDPTTLSDITCVTSKCQPTYLGRCKHGRVKFQIQHKEHSDELQIVEDCPYDEGCIYT